MNKPSLRFIFLPLLLTSCLDIETLSVIHEDGSIRRQVKQVGSLGDLEKSSFNVPRADSLLWEISITEQNDDKVVYQATRDFASTQELNESWSLNARPHAVQIKAMLEKSRGLFFTRFHYREEVWADLPGPDLPMSDYLSETELQLLLKSEDDRSKVEVDSVEQDRLEQQLDVYISRRAFEDFLPELRAGAESIKKTEELEAVLLEHGDSLETRLNATNYYNENMVWKSILGDYLDPDIVDAINVANLKGLQEFYQRWLYFEDILLNGYHFKIQMPGVIRQTNADEVLGNVLSWHPESSVLLFGGVTCEAESSMVNIWSSVLTGIVLLLTLIVTLLGFMRQRSKRVI